MLRLPFRPLLLSLAALACLAAPPRTLRVDYGHTGDATSEHFGLDRVVLEPLPWPGDLAKAIDTSNLGKYCFEVADKATGKLLYSRGFASIYGEWETTDEAKALSRAFSESLRFPRPEAPVRIQVKKRDARNVFQVLWTFELDPRDPLIEQAPAPEAGGLITLQKNGDSADKVDVLILGDGYTAAERGKFERQARMVMEKLFEQSRSGSTGRTSTSGPSARLPPKAASPGPPRASTSAPPWAPPLMPSAASATCSPSTTAPSATSPPRPPTSSWKSW